MSGLSWLSVILIVGQLITGYRLAAQQIIFKRYAVSDGLSSNTIYSTAQDQLGFMWFGTEDGLNRFDGYTFRHYEFNPTDTQSIPNNVVRCLLVDADNTIWVGTDDGLCVFDQITGTFRRFTKDTLSDYGLNNQHITALTETKDFICIGTNGGGVNMFNKQTGSMIQLSRDPALSGITSITALASDNQNTLWIGTSDQGLIRYKTDTKEVKRFNSEGAPPTISENYIASIYVSRNQMVWIGTLNSGLNQIDPVSGSIVTYANNIADESTLSQNTVFSITEDAQGIIWVGTLGGGLNAFYPKNKKFTRYQNNTLNPTSLSNNTVWCAMIERSGTLWVGTTYGLNTYNKSHIKFKTTTISDLSNNNIYAITPAGNGELWAGVLGNGLVRLSANSVLQKNYRVSDGLPSENITALYQVRSGLLYIGTMEGLAVLEPSQNRISRIQLNGKSSDFITALYEDSNNRLWIGTKGSGAYKLMRQSNNPEPLKKLNSKWVTSFIEDKDGNIWIGTAGGGINIIKKENTVTYLKFSEQEGSVSSDYINCLARTSSGIIYVGTYGGGLNVTKTPGSLLFNHYNEADELSDNIILALAITERDDVWFSTGNGITNIRTQKYGKPIFRNFNELDGLQYKYNTSAAAYLGNSTIAFGGLTGLSLFNVGEINYNKNKPAVVITSFKLFDKEYKLDSLISIKRYVELNYNQNFISFEFSGLNYVFPDKNSYTYILEGSESEWVDAGNRRYVAYTNLDPGTYYFRVKAANNDGVWNEEGKSITVVIKPPFWRTWWFYTMVFIVVLLSIYGIFQLRTRRLRRANTLLETRVNERTQELTEEKEKVEKQSFELQQAFTDLKQTQQQLIQSEKMASLGQLTAGIAHEIKNPLNFVNNFSKLSNELFDEFKQCTSEQERVDLIKTIQLNLSKINEHGIRANNIVSSMMMHARQISSDKQLCDINKLLDDTTSLAFQGVRSSLAEFKCAIKKDYDHSIPKINLIQQDISRVILNLLNNSFYAVHERYRSGASQYEPQVSVSSRLSDAKLVITITDNGTGIQDDIKDKIFQPFFTTKPAGKGTGLGLSLSFEIVKAHAGEMIFTSQFGKSTSFIITLPLT